MYKNKNLSLSVMGLTLLTSFTIIPKGIKGIASLNIIYEIGTKIYFCIETSGDQIVTYLSCTSQSK